MSRFFNVGVFATVASLSLWAGATPSRADLVTDLAVDVTPKAGGLFEYDYSLSDGQGSSLGASQLFLAVSPRADLSSISAPSGWDVFYTPGDPDISFLSSDPSLDVPPGSFGLFSVTSPVGPASGDFLVRGFDYNAGSFSDNTGAILTPSAVPEPSGLALGVLGAACVAAIGQARRRGPRS